MWKSYNFWVRLVAVAVLLLRIVGAEFGFEVDSDLIINIATAVASVLVVLGVINVPASTDSRAEKGENNELNSSKGENFMEISEKIKQDIFKAKEKIITELAGLGDVSGVISILDEIVNQSEGNNLVQDEEKISEPQEVIIESGEAKDGEVALDVPAEPDGLIESENLDKAVKEVEVELEKISSEVVTEAVGDADEDHTLREILKSRLKKIIETEMETIVTELA